MSQLSLFKNVCMCLKQQDEKNLAKPGILGLGLSLLWENKLVGK
jgi:hypothetical protein